MKRLCPLLAGAALLVLITGCPSGPKLVLAKGKLTYKQEPFKPTDPKGGITVVFIPVVEKGANFNTYPADLNRDDMTFVVSGKDGRGIPEGRYKISINQQSMSKSAEMERMNKLFAPEKTAIERSVKVENETIVIDLNKPEG